MRGMQAMIVGLAWALAACVSAPDAPPLPAVAELEERAESPAALAVSLLSAAEASPDGESRLPYVQRLDSLGVRVEQDQADDPLSAWRADIVQKGPVWRGRTLGPAYRRARLAPGESMAMEQVFYAGERAEIAAQASRGAKVELAIRDREAKKVCARTLSPQARCLWLPRFTERFAITLTNHGTKPASIYLVLN